jgi:cellulose biosynthesis protein BcsQ
VTTTLVVINYSPGRGLLTINVLVAARRVLLRRLKETDDLLETFLRSRQPSNSGLRIPGHGDPGSGRDPAAALSRRGRTTLLIDLARSQQQDLVSWATS